MAWGGGITHIAETTLKGRQVRFGIKDADRTTHLSLIGSRGPGRSGFLASMALGDIARGAGTVVIDAAGNVTSLLLERLSPEERQRLVYLDPSDGEYPFSWNPLADFRIIPEERALPLLTDALLAVYRMPESALVDFAAKRMLKDEKATALLLYELVADERARNAVLPAGTPERAEFDRMLSEDPESVERITQNGRYLAKDTLMRNILGQTESKFSLRSLADGAIVVLDLSRIRMFPTRIAPLSRMLLYTARALSAETGTPACVYLYESLRTLAEADLDILLPERILSFAIGDSLFHDEDKELREKVLMQSGAVLVFSGVLPDAAAAEKIFYPYAGAEDFEKLEAGELAVILTIDGVRSRPFFARQLPLPERKSVSYHDIQVDARRRFGTPRSTVDRAFEKRFAPPPSANPADPKAFSSTFRSIFAKNAAGAAPGGAAAPKPANPAPAAPVPKADASSEPREVSEDELKKMLYVTPPQ